MTVRRVMGIETEYSIVVPGNPAANPMVASGDVVTAYAASRGIRPARASWDYADEASLRDARGFDMGRGTATPASSPTSRTPRWPTSCSPTAPGSTSTMPTRSTALRRSPPAGRRHLGPGR